MAGSVIQATGTLEFEDDLKRGNQFGPETLFRGSALYLRSMVPLVSGVSWTRFPRVGESPSCLLLYIIGINIQLLCDVRIEQAYKVGIFVLFPGLARVDINFELLDWKGYYHQCLPQT